MTNDKDVMPVLSRIIAEALSVAPEKVRREARIFGDLGAESIDLLDIRFRIESEFGLVVDPDQLPATFGDSSPAAESENELTVGTLEDFLSRYLARKRTP